MLGLDKDNIYRLLRRSSWILATLLFVYHCVYDPEPSLRCSPEEAILTPEQATAYAMKRWPGVREGEPRKKFLAEMQKFPPKFVKYSASTDRGKWVWVVNYDLTLVFDKCGKVYYEGAS